MIASRSLGAVAALAFLFAAAPALGQEMAAGTWSGTILPPDEPGIDVEYVVEYDDDGALQITLIPPAGLGAPPEIPFNEVMLEEGSLTFSWTVETTHLTCELILQEDETFEGECWDESGEPGVLTMVPPEKSDG